MRIGFLIHRFGPRPGGIQIFTLELARLLREHDPKSDAHILTWRTHEDEKSEEETEGTKIIRFKLPWPSKMYEELRRLFFKNVFLFLSATIFYIIFCLRPLSKVLMTHPVRIWRKCLNEAIRGFFGFILATYAFFYTFHRSDYDIIQAHELFLGMASLFTRRVRRIKVPIIFAYLWVLSEPFFLELEAELVKRIDGAILFDDGTAEVKLKKWGVPRENVFITTAILNCRKLKRILSQRNKVHDLKRKLGLTKEKVVLFVGRLSPEKGVDHVVLVFPKVLKRIPNVKLILCGPVSDQKYLQRLLQYVENAGVKEHTLLTGEVPYSGVPSYYLAADVYVSSSPLSNVSLSSREAMLAGKAIVVSNSGGTGKIIRNGETGLLFDHGNLKQFCDKIISLLTNPELSKTLGTTAKQYAEQTFCLEGILPSLVAMYKKLMG